MDINKENVCRVLWDLAGARTALAELQEEVQAITEDTEDDGETKEAFEDVRNHLEKLRNSLDLIQGFKEITDNDLVTYVNAQVALAESIKKGGNNE